MTRKDCRGEIAVKAAVRAILLAMAVVLAIAMPANTAPVEAEPADFPVAGGHFYAQAGPEPGAGYTIADEDGVPFWQAFQALGGVEALGYPISRRFIMDGLVAQATQKAILQWDSASRIALRVNVMDRLHDAGADASLAACCAVPAPLSDEADAGKSADQVIGDRLALLDANPAIREAYFNAQDPLHDYGLPTSAIEDRGTNFTLRLQRAVIQQWKVSVPWANAGQITFANVGELARFGNLIPAEALLPEMAAPGAVVKASSPSPQVSMIAPAQAAGPATVRVIAPPTGSGTGFILSADGLVITANHVVDGAHLLAVMLPDGTRLPATLVGADPFTDVALLRVAQSGLPTLTLGASANIGVGDVVTALGYGATSPREREAKTGTITDLASSRRPGESAPTAFLLTNVGLEPGFSGGPLVDAEGRVVGLNTAVLYLGRNPSGPTVNLSVAIDTVKLAVRRLLSGEVTPAQSIGFTSADLSDELAASFNLAVARGALVVRVEPSSLAALAGMAPGDIVIKVNDELVYGSDDLASVMARTRPGDRISLQVVSHDGTWRTLTVVTQPSR
ncbi:MAG: S1C family serine protease [Chloroflexota bacterium]